MSEPTTNRVSIPCEIRALSNDEIELSFSSETPCPGRGGMEVLGHNPGEVDLARLNSGGAVLFEHDRAKQIGVVLKAWIDTAARKCRALVRPGTSALAREVFADVRAGIRRLVSVGYSVHQSQKTASGTRATKWEPLEISIVSIPADVSVGVGRSHHTNRNRIQKTNTPLMSTTTAKPAARLHTMRDFENGNITTRLRGFNEWRDAIFREAGQIESACTTEGRAPTDEEAANLDEGQRMTKLIDARIRTEQAELSRQSSQRDGNYRADLNDGTGEPDLRNYSILRALRCASAGRLDGLEAEVSQEIANRSGKAASGFYLPLSVLAKRTLVTKPIADGGAFVPTEQGGFIDALRPRLEVAKLNATLLSGLSGNVSLPRQSAASTASWKGETATLDEQSPQFDQVTLTPKRVGAFTQFSKQLFVQTSSEVETLVSNDLIAAVAVAIDKAAINGSGENGEPLGILNEDGILKVAIAASGGPVTWANLVALQKALADANADANPTAYLTNPSVRAKLQGTMFDTGSGVTLWDRALGLGAWGVSTNCPSNLTKGSGTKLSALIAGDFSQLLIGTFGEAADVVVDPYTKATEGINRVIINCFVDVAVRRPEYFAAITDAATT